MNPAKYHLRVGDLLHNPKNGAFGLITKVTRYYFHFFLMSKSLDAEEKMLAMEDKARRETVYESIDAEVILPYYGTTKRRRKRKIYVDIDEQL